LVGRDPRQFQFDFALWTRRIVRDLIRRQFGVEMTPQGVGLLLRRLGLSPQRPLYRAYQQNPEAVRRWKQEQFPAIREQARREGAEVYFGDESGVRTDHHAGTTWAPVGQTPVVEVTGECKSVNMISAVSPGGALHFDVFFSVGAGGGEPVAVRGDRQRAYPVGVAGEAGCVGCQQRYRSPGVCGTLRSFSTGPRPGTRACGAIVPGAAPGQAPWVQRRGRKRWRRRAAAVPGTRWSERWWRACEPLCVER
jgi:hypothetical protein